MAQHPTESPWAIQVAQVGRRPGLTQDVDVVMPAPTGIGDDFFGIQQDSDVHVTGRIDSLAEGLLISGTATASVTGSCGRCLKRLDQDWPVQFTAYFPYEAPEDKSFGDEDIDAEEDEGDDTYPLAENGTIMDLELLLRDYFVESLPAQPLCKPDCLGLCPECGVDLNENPDHSHEKHDIRWADLEALKKQLEERSDADDSADGSANSSRAER